MSPGLRLISVLRALTPAGTHFCLLCREGSWCSSSPGFPPFTFISTVQPRLKGGPSQEQEELQGLTLLPLLPLGGEPQWGPSSQTP